MNKKTDSESKLFQITSNKTARFSSKASARFVFFHTIKIQLKEIRFRMYLIFSSFFFFSTFFTFQLITEKQFIWIGVRSYQLTS
jgi:hypothetical protein